ncbi:RluA family pseudouridine synthase [Carboxylicivirga sp. RSCT41]|uniref:RluA family pseudouridine synthase n=1 Tax=Carboxylicivirga agarovorans TaxID=3417570 RepID=UPI003D33CA5A
MQCFYPITEQQLNELPNAFNDPFDYSPHPLCIYAKEQLETKLPLPSEMNKGKMYGVLIVKNDEGQLGYLTACSGNEKEESADLHFVPQVYDITNPSGYFRTEEQKLNKINEAIKSLKNSSELELLKQQLSTKEKTVKQTIDEIKEQNKINKARRDIVRQSTSDNAIHQQLIKESQTEKSQFNKLKKQLKEELDALKETIKTHHDKISTLKALRKSRSAEIQQELFNNYIFVNANGEKASATEIFRQKLNTLPPAGTGDCAAPKLLQYAFLNSYEPIALAEFWWGPSPQKEVRRHGSFYPACKSKCEPLLGFMLQGLPVDSDKQKQTYQIELLFEDPSFMIINKPSGLLSVPGKSKDESVYSQIRQLRPQAEEPFIVHRLDRDTSGLMIISKTKQAYVNIQKQFLNRDVRKQYVAILQGTIKGDTGIIDLPLRVDLEDRPRQLVCDQYGKPARTEFKVIKRHNNQTRICFCPLTGRTHQLRVHAAHIKGLNTPIIGDVLYGQKATRLMLHAETIAFKHPVTNKVVSFNCPAPF